MWKMNVREINNYTCCVTGKKSNIVVHHCRSFNLLFQETIDNLGFEIKDKFSEYNDEELELFVENNSLLLKKNDNSDEIAQNCANWVDQHQRQIISVSMVNNTTICVFKTDNGELKSASATYNHSDKFDINVAICYCAKKVGFEVEGI